MCVAMHVTCVAMTHILWKRIKSINDMQETLAPHPNPVSSTQNDA